MASNFVPMLSASPPPLDDCPDDDDDDFGNFASANIPFDSSFDSPVSTSKQKSYKAGDNGVNNLSLNNDFNSKYSFSDPEFSNHLNDVSHKSEIINVHVNKQNTCDDRELPFPDSPTDVNEIKYNETSKPESIKSFVSCDASSVLSSTDSHDEETIQSSEPIQLKLCLDDDDIEDESSDSVSTVPAETSINIKLSHTDSNKYQSNLCGLFNNSNYSDCDAKSDGAQSSDISFECFKENNFDSENLEFTLKGNSSENLEFHADFSAAEDDFNDFQQAFPSQAQITDINSDIISKESSSQSKADDEFRTDFNNIQNSENCDSEYDEDFDDFQGFNKASSACVENGVSETDSKALSGDEDFQDFKKCEPTEDEADEFDEFQGCSASENSSTQEFANFESVSFEEKAQSDSPQFADFESASFSSDETRPNLACASSSQDKSFDKIATVLNAIFPPVSESSDDYCDQPTEILEQSNKSHRLWEKLHEVEQAPSLRFQWGVSHSFQQLLRSINVDYHSILRTSSVPIFASSLSLLEPVKGQARIVNAESEDRRKTKTPNLNDPIPPVEFDWTSSGLVNPLDSGQAASVLMDLSFLATSDTATSPSTDNHSFENELLKPSPMPACSESLNKTLILEELLSKNVCSLPNSKTTHRPPNISEEANSVLDQLPDLSFMRAKVLMFPISSKT